MLSLCLKVLQLVSEIPKGTVMTYKELAKQVGCKSIRATANCLKLSTTKDAKVDRQERGKRIPCHRVIRSDGRVGKYFGSLRREKEKALRLKQEGVALKEVSGKFWVKKLTQAD